MVSGKDFCCPMADSHKAKREYPINASSYILKQLKLFFNVIFKIKEKHQSNCSIHLPINPLFFSELHAL